MTDAEFSLSLPEVSSFVRELARDQARVVLDRWAAAQPLTFKDRRDFATAVDLEVEETIKESLAERFPDHGLAGEETAPVNPSAPYQWLIDPIDGTKYYAGQAHLFSISLGLSYDGDPVLGVIHVPASGQVFHAYVGNGAFLGDTRLEGSSATSLEDAIVNVDMPNSNELAQDERFWFESKLLELTRRTYRVRALGIGSLAACWLASGVLDGYVDLTGYNKPQDVAAGRIILSESGIRVDYLEPPVGPPRLVAAPRAIWPDLAALLMDPDRST